MKLLYPAKNYQISQEFGVNNASHLIRKTFYTMFDYKHPGVDFRLPERTPIFAAHDGIVVRKEFHKGMGNVLGTRFGNVVVLYAHLSQFSDLKLSDIVKQGKTIGLSGNTGEACTEPHLHFELRDISKNELKQMVFKPVFNEEIANQSYTFKYKVNNTNTKKSLAFLSERYFGTNKYWEKIHSFNKLLPKYSKKEIKNGQIVTIPNYL